MTTNYDSSAIEVLTGLEPVRKRPGMYTTTERPNHLAQEVIDNSADEGIASWLQSRAAERLRVIRLDPPLGFGAAVNAGIDAAAGEVCVLFDQSVELRGDAIAPLLSALDDSSVVVAGPFGLRAKGTVKEFEDSLSWRDRLADRVAELNGSWAFILILLGISVVWPLLLADVNNEARHPALAIGGVTACGYLGMVAGPPLVGLVSSAFGLRTGLMVLAAIAMFVALTPAHVRARSGPRAPVD